MEFRPVPEVAVEACSVLEAAMEARSVPVALRDNTRAPGGTPEAHSAPVAVLKSPLFLWLSS